MTDSHRIQQMEGRIRFWKAATTGLAVLVAIGIVAGLFLVSRVTFEQDRAERAIQEAVRQKDSADRAWLRVKEADEAAKSLKKK